MKTLINNSIMKSETGREFICRNNYCMERVGEKECEFKSGDRKSFDYHMQSNAFTIYCHYLNCNSNFVNYNNYLKHVREYKYHSE
jgi:hypothetical protein